MLIKSEKKSGFREPSIPKFNEVLIAGKGGQTLIDASGRLSHSAQRIRELEHELAETQRLRYEEGLAVGRKQGYQEGVDEIKPSIDQFTAIVAQVQEQQEALLKEAQDFMITFTFKIVERILGSEPMRQVKLDRTKVMDLVQDVANQFAKSATYVFRVHPETAGMLTGLNQKIQALLPGAALSIVDDLSLRPGECLVESDFGVLDATFMAQLKQIETYFRK